MTAEVVYVTDRDDHGNLLEGLFAITPDDRIVRVELAPGMVVIGKDGLTRFEGKEKA